MALIELARHGELKWIGSDILDLESSRNPDIERRRRVEALLNCAISNVAAGERERQRGRELQAIGFAAFDALHIACAESAGAEVLLTTDDRLRARAVRETARLAVQVENPAKWYSEALEP